MGGKREKLKNRVELLQLLKSFPHNKRQKLIKILDEQSIHNISECLCNIFKNTFNLKASKCNHIRKKFYPHKQDILKLIDPKTNIKKKKEVLSSNQLGSGLFTVLATIALPAIISALTAR